MDQLVNFFERLVSDFTPQRIGLLGGLLVLAFVGFGFYEVYSGHFRSARMKFTADHLVKLADPELKKNIAGDEELLKAHQRMKSDLNRFLEGWQSDVPEPILTVAATASAWLIISFMMFIIVGQRGEGRTIFGMGLVGAFIFGVVGAVLPTFSWWINYVVYPFGSALLVIVSFALLGLATNRVT